MVGIYFVKFEIITFYTDYDNQENALSVYLEVSENKTESVTNEATLCSIIGGLIIPPFARSKGRILCNKLITPVTNKVINNKALLRICL